MLTRHPLPARPIPALDRPSAADSLSIEVAGDLGVQLRNLAVVAGQPPEVLGRRLLARALEQEIRRARAERTLARLTARQLEVAWLAADGSTNRQIAEALVISTETVKTHVANVLERLDLHSKAELRLLLLELGLPARSERQSAPDGQGSIRLAPLAAHREAIRSALPVSDSGQRLAREAGPAH
jgi:DNA-binding CsgD family transcriptional regulator